MANFFAELKIYRVAAAYAVVAWALLKIVNNDPDNFFQVNQNIRPTR